MNSLDRPINKIMVAAGFFLLVMSVFLFTPLWQWLSMASFLSGVLLILFGAFLQFESLKPKVPSREGWGTILVFVAVMSMACAVMFLFFAVPGGVFVINMPTRLGRGGGSVPLLYVKIARPDAWLTPILGGIGLVLLIFGIVLKLSRGYY